MAEEEKEEEPKKGGLMRIIMMVIGVIALVGVGIGAGYFYLEENLLIPLKKLKKLLKEKMKEAEEAKAAEEAANAGPQKKKPPRLKSLLQRTTNFQEILLQI